jgi:cell division protein FtsZ
MFNIPDNETSIIKVIGVGGGGSNAVSYMYKQGIVGVDFAICNTDNQAMAQSHVPVKIQLGMSLTEGRGAGSKPNVGRECCLESLEEVKTFFSENTKMLFVTAGMGGGTGTGAAPVIAKAAREMDILTVAIVTMPFTFEGRRRSQQAFEGLAELKKNVDTLIVISNDKLRKIFGNLTITNAFAQADEILTTAAKGIAEIITVPGYVNVDFEDVNTVMRDSGVAVMGTAAVEGEDRAIRAVEAALQSPLLEDSDIKGAKHILLNISSGAREVTMDEIFEITEYVQEEAGQGTDLIWGNCFDESLGEKLSVTVIATGFSSNKKEGQNRTASNEISNAGTDKKVGPQIEKQPVRVNLDDDDDFSNFSKNSAFKMEQDQQNSFGKKIEPIQSKMLNESPEPYFKEEDHFAQNENAEDRKHRQKAQGYKIDSPELISELENKPAYLRKGLKLDNIEHSSEKNLSRWVISDEAAPEIKDSNSYLHDNVD